MQKKLSEERKEEDIEDTIGIGSPIDTSSMIQEPTDMYMWQLSNHIRIAFSSFRVFVTLQYLVDHNRFRLFTLTPP